MKIAICLSGQPRSLKYTIPSIINYFQGDYEVDYFCHSWNYNTWKQKTNEIFHSPNEVIETETLYSDLSVFKPKKALVQSFEEGTIRGPWHSLCYSLMMSNNLKKQYEIENNFRYDVVVKARYDVIYDPNKKFTPKVTCDDNLVLFINHSGRAPAEYNRINISDVFFFGNSYTMDVVTDIYRFVYAKHSNFRADNIENLGPGVLISEYCNNTNVIFKNYSHQEVIYRKEMIPTDPITDFEEIQKNHRWYYQ